MLNQKPQEFDTFVDALKATITEKGFKQVDNRLNRTTQNLSSHFIEISNSKVLEWLRREEVLEKYKDDSKRMYSSFKKAIVEAKKDPNSRRLMVFNDSRFNEIYQCFTSFHFVYTKRNEFDMIVYQRSSDLIKLKDDLVFFANQMKKFERGTDYYVTKLIVIYGSIHYEIDVV